MPDKINLHIPEKNRISAIFDLLIESIATTTALQDFTFMKLMEMSGDTKEQIKEKLSAFIDTQKESIEQFRNEITASVMSKYTE